MIRCVDVAIHELSHRSYHDFRDFVAVLSGESKVPSRASLEAAAV